MKRRSLKIYRLLKNVFSVTAVMSLVLMTGLEQHENPLTLAVVMVMGFILFAFLSLLMKSCEIEQRKKAALKRFGYAWRNKKSA